MILKSTGGNDPMCTMLTAALRQWTGDRDAHGFATKLEAARVLLPRSM